MRDNNTVKNKSLTFAIKIVEVYKLLSSNQEYILSKQLLRSGTSIGANINEALCGISKKDFLAKMYIAFKESAETLYWLQLLYSTGYISYQQYTAVYQDCEELKKMLCSITKTTSASLNS